MGLKADLAHAAAGVVSPLVSGIAPSVSPSVDAMLTSELGFGNKGPSLQV